jgi:hypothetical protein
MKNRTPLLIASAAIFVAAVFSSASAQSVDMIVRVPFEFQVGDTTLPRDVYSISRMTGSGGALMVRGERRGVFILAQSGEQRTDSDPKLLFHRIGDQYFLREVQLRGLPSLAIPESPTEREARELVASAGPTAIQRVVVAPR